MSAQNRAALIALLNEKILSGGKRTSAANLRLVNQSIIESLVAILDDKDVADGYLGIGSNGKVDNSFIDSPVSSLSVDYTDHGNVGTGETILDVFVMDGDILKKEGDVIEANYCGSVVASGSDTRRFKLYFNGVNIFDTTAIVCLGTSWIMKAQIMRSGPSTVRFFAQFIARTGGLANIIIVDESTTIDFTQPIQIKITGQSSANTDEIILKTAKINYLKAP